MIQFAICTFHLLFDWLKMHDVKYFFLVEIPTCTNLRRIFTKFLSKYNSITEIIFSILKKVRKRTLLTKIAKFTLRCFSVENDKNLYLYTYDLQIIMFFSICIKTFKFILGQCILGKCYACKK